MFKAMLLKIKIKIFRNAPDPIQSVMIRGKGKGRGRGGKGEGGRGRGWVLIITPWMGSGAFLYRANPIQRVDYI